MLKRFISFLWKKKSLSVQFTELCEELAFHENLAQAYKTKKTNLSYWLTISFITFFVPIFIIMYSVMDKYNFKLISTIFLVVIPFTFVVVRNIFLWHYSNKINKLELKCAEMTLLREEMISNVMENETYKNVYELFSKYAPEKLSQNAKSENEQIDPKIWTPKLENEAEDRLNANNLEPRRKQTENIPQCPVDFKRNSSFMIPVDKEGQKINLPRPLVLAGSGVVGRFMDYILGDGPQNRYALICHDCFTHNGMALSDDVGNLVYKCYFCKSLNYLGVGGSIALSGNDDSGGIKRIKYNGSEDNPSSDLDIKSLKDEPVEEQIEEGNVGEEAKEERETIKLEAEELPC